jgi:arylamine N-acetyltransferase
VTAILRRRAHLGRPVPPVDHLGLLTAWEERRGGGVCFEAADMAGRLLAALGYRVEPVLATISLPDGHAASLVELAGERWLVDVAQGTPLFEPIPLDRGPVEVRHAGLAYRFRPLDAERWVQDRGEQLAWCRYDLLPPTAERRAAMYQGHHAPGASWVVGELTVVRSTEDAVYRLKGDQLTTHTERGTHTEPLDTPAARQRAAAELFALPNLPIESARQALADMLPRP